MTLVVATTNFMFLVIRGLDPWTSIELTFVLLGGLALVANGRIAWLRSALRGALNASHAAGRAEQTGVTDLPVVNRRWGRP